MTHKYRGCIIVLLINKSVEPNEEQKVLTSGFDQGFTINTSKGQAGCVTYDYQTFLRTHGSFCRELLLHAAK
jgi:hypothetical protein